MNRLATGLLLSLLAATAQGEVVGRVLLAAGDVTAVRGGRSLPLALGADVESGDRIRTGAASNAQIRFTDSGMVALRPETEFAVEQYNFAGRQDASDRAIFRLLKGGMRTITGLIGRLNQRNYGVRTPTSTIGIRGTHFNLVQCDDNCRNADGTLAPNGTYGAVSDGRVAVTPLNAPQQAVARAPAGKLDVNGLQFASAAGPSDVPAIHCGIECQSGGQPALPAPLDGLQLAQAAGGGPQERIFGAGEFFRVPDANTSPVPLIAPPGFLFDRLEGQSRARPGQAVAGAPAGGGGAAGGAAGGTTGGTNLDTRAETPPLPPAPLPFVSTQSLGASGTSSAIITGITGFIAQYPTGTSSFEVIEDCNGSSGGCSGNKATSFTFSGNTLTSYGSGTAFPSGMLGSGTVVDAGTATIAGAQFGWGRWTGNFSVIASSGTLTGSSTPSGVMFGFTNDPTVGTNTNTPLPGSGVVSYVLVGGPNPVDTAGNVGSITSMSGTVDFTTRNVGFNMGLAINIPSQGPASMTLSGGGVIPTTNNELSSATMTGTCTGSGCISPSPGGTSGQFDARFAGTAAQAMVVNGGVINSVKDQTFGPSMPRSVLFMNLLKCSTC